MRPSEGGRSADEAAEPRADLLEGSAYRVVKQLGAGGMGEVFEAEHRALGHHVVVKLMREELSARPEMMDRMRVEAQSLARIRHPNLVMVTDLGQTRTGQPFIVMERLVGRSLHEELHARSMLPVAEAAEIGRQMLLGLSVAHEAGLVHRDIKPDNVFLCESEDGRPHVKVLDFGVVKIAQAGRDPRTPEPPAVPTAENIALGTPRYFSPEQGQAARDLDARSDLYSVGLVLYGMVVGHGPFDHHRRLADVFHAHATEVPLPPSASATQPVPAVFDRLVMRALAKRREDRPQTALAFAEELGRFVSSLGAEGRRVNATVQVPEDEQETIELGDRESSGESATLEAATHVGAAAVEAEDATATASPVVAPTRGRAPGKLPEGPVMIDHLVSRVLGSAPPPGPRPSSPDAMGATVPLPGPRPSSPDAMGATVPLIVQTAPLAPNVAALVRGAAEQNTNRGHGAPVPAARPSSPEPTAPDVESGRPSSPSPTELMPAGSVPVAAPSGPERRSVPETAPMFEVGTATLSSPGALRAPPSATASGGWTGSLTATAAVLLVLVGAMIGYLMAR